MTRLVPLTGGTVRINGTDISRLSRRRLRPLRRDFNIVFQDPASSLNPRMTVADIVGEPLRLHRIGSRGRAGRGRVDELLDQVGLRAEVGRRYPHELSGGQRQRVSLARALSAGPSLLVADEPTSALDVSVQAAVLNLIGRLQAELGFACLFITHDLAAVEFLAQRVAVMYLGVLVEVADRAQPVRRAAPPVHAGAAVGGADPGPGRCSGPGGGSCSPARCRARCRPAVGVPVPPPVSGRGASVRRVVPAAAPGRAGRRAGRLPPGGRRRVRPPTRRRPARQRWPG